MYPEFYNIDMDLEFDQFFKKFKKKKLTCLVISKRIGTTVLS